MTMMKMVWERLGEWWHDNDNNDEVGGDNDEEEKMNMTMMTRQATVDLETISGTTGLLLHETLAMMTVTTMMLTMMTMATMMLTAPDANANPLPILRGDKNMNNENSISGSEDGDKNDVSQQLRNRNN